MAERILLDTTALAHLTKASRHSGAYNRIIGHKRIVLSFQSRPELLGANYAPSRQKRLDALLAVVITAPHSAATDVWYARVVAVRKQLKAQSRMGGDAGDADAWIIASALEHSVPLMSHDRQQVELARACDCPTYTDLDELRAGNP